MNYVGIDLASKSSAIAVVDAQGHLVHQCEVPTEERRLQKALKGFGPLHAVIEAASLAEWVSRTLEAAGHSIDIVDARAAKRLMDARKKTDARDARTLAQLARSGWYQPVHRKSEQARLLRSRLKLRQGLVQSYTKMGSQIRGVLRAHGLRVGRVSKGAFADRVREMVSHHEPALLECVEPLLAIYEQSLADAKKLERWIDKASRADETRRRLRSVPGVGPLTSELFVATIDTPERFNNGDQVADYIGLTPGVNQSGDRCVRGPITRNGDSLLRWHLVEAANALMVLGRDCRLKRWAQRLAQEKSGAKARVALARKLAIVLWRLWQTGERFDPQLEASPAA